MVSEMDVAKTCWIIETHSRFIYTIIIQGREIYVRDFIEYAFNIGTGRI